MQKTGTFLLGLQPTNEENLFGTIRDLNRQFSLGIHKKDIATLSEAFGLTKSILGPSIEEKIIVPYFNLRSKEALPSLMECLRYRLKSVGVEDLFFNFGVMDIIAACQRLGDGESGLATVSFVPGGIRRYDSQLFIEMIWTIIVHPEIVIGCGQNRPRLIIPGATMKITHDSDGDKKRKHTCTVAVTHTGAHLLFETMNVRDIDHRVVVPVPHSAIA